MTQRQNKSDALLKLKESFDSVGTKFNDLTWQRIDTAMEEYALEAIKADRDRVAEITRIWQDEEYPDWVTLREAIRNLPIELK